jgi:methylmalonyl-CoA mutase N-terminal domain/subunit
MIHPYTIREGGCTLVQELAFGLACTIALCEACLERGLDIDDFAPKLTLNFSVHMNLFEEVAKFRAARRLWAKIMKERFNAKKPASMMCRSGPGTGGSTLTAQQPENNIIRVTIEALAAVLGGVQYLHTSSFDEALATPTERAVTIAIRTQQILAHESGVADVIDPLGGSYYVESLTSKIEEEVRDYLKKIEAVGGVVKAIEIGWAQREIARSAYQQQRDIEQGRKIIVGVNKFCSDEKPTFEIHRPDPKVAEYMNERMKKLRRERSKYLVQCALDEISKAARTKENLVPFILNGVKNYATMGDICNVLRDVFGTYKAPSIF